MGWKKGLLGFLLKGLMICVSFVAVFAVTYRLNQSYLRSMTETAGVVTVRGMLLPGEAVTAEVLQVSEKPVMGLGEDYLGDLSKFMGEGPWYAGETGFGPGDVLRPSRLVHAADMGGDWHWEFSRQDDVRLIAVETSLVRSSGDWLWPGMVVDAMVYIPAKDSYDEKLPSEIIGPEDDPLLGGLLVIDKKNASGLSLDNQASVEGYSRDALPAVVTLMIDKDDVERIKALIKYNEEGKIYFSPVADKSGW